jgi:hypothetical protein
VTRITQSKLETYLRCGIRWDFERQDPTRHATVRMLVGSGVAAGAAEDNHAKITRGSPASLGTIIDAAVAGYDLDASESEVPEPKSEISRGRDDAAAAARCFGVQVSPALPGVIAAEAPMLAVLRGVELAGTPDVVTEEGIGDGKVGQPWTQARADRSRQLSGYGILHRIHLGRFPRRLWIDSISFSRGEWRWERLWTARAEEDYSAFLEAMTRAAGAMQAGIALPAPEGAFWCSKAWCPHWGRCPAVGRR